MPQLYVTPMIQKAVVPHCEIDDPAVASIRGVSVSVEGCLGCVVEICWCGRDFFELDGYGLG